MSSTLYLVSKIVAFSGRIAPSTYDALRSLPSDSAVDSAFSWLERNPRAGRERRNEAIRYLGQGAADVKIVSDLTPYRGSPSIYQWRYVSLVGKTVVIRPSKSGRWGKSKAIRVV